MDKTSSTKTSTHSKPLTSFEKNTICLGTILEWMEYSLYGLLIQPISLAFFPFENDFYRYLFAWLFFASGLVARFIGVYFFHQTWSRFGQKFSLLLSLNMMGLACLTLSLLPTYATVGILAPCLLLICRLVQGISMSGEFLAANFYLYDGATGKQEQVSNPALLLTSSCLGIVLGALLAKFSLMSPLDSQVTWRLPFFLGGSLSLLSWSFRKRLEDNFQPSKTPSPVLNWTYILNQISNKSFWVIYLLAAALCVHSSLCQSYYMSYMAQSSVDLNLAFNSQILGQIICASTITFVSRTAAFENVGQHLLFATLLLIPESFMFFYCAQSADSTYIYIAQVLYGIFHGYFCSCLLTSLCLILPSNSSRFLTIGLPWSLAVVSFGAFSPSLSLTLETLTGFEYCPAMMISIVSFSAALSFSRVLVAPYSLKRA